MFLEHSRMRIKESYEKVRQDLGAILDPVELVIRTLPEEEAFAMRYLYAFMPYSDIANNPVETYLDFVRHGVRLYEEKEEVRELPESVYLQYVLFHRVNEEEIRPCRSLFYHQIQEQIRGKSPLETVLEINYWCAGEVAYEAGDDRTLSALSVWKRGYGRCGEESVFAVNVLRSAGIPARQVYAPYWSHCDDNHAWVEVWVDGNWHYLGACEPEPLLDLGWFEYAASRAMLIHVRRFDGERKAWNYDTEEPESLREEEIGSEGMVTMENEIRRYADGVQTLEVLVLDEKGRPVSDLPVSFEVVNYAAFRPIANCHTDMEGKVRLSCGAGSLHLYCGRQDKAAEEILDTRRDSRITLTLQRNIEEYSWQEFDMIPPSDRTPVARRPDAAQKEEGARRLAALRTRQERKRKAWENPDRNVFVNEQKRKSEKEQRMGRALLKILTAKDQTDVRLDVLKDHLSGAMLYAGTVPEEIFIKHMLNPRVEDEILTPYRRWFQHEVPKEAQERFRNNPESLWTWICQEIRECPEHERSTVLTTPAACFRIRCGSRRSKAVLYVAMARSFGIAARLNEADGMPEYWKQGRFMAADPNRRKDCVLVLRAEEPGTWRYSQNWSLTRISATEQKVLRLRDEGWKKQKKEIFLESGTYRLMTATRLPNGTVHAAACQFLLTPGEHREVQLQSRKSNLMEILESLSLPEFEVHKEDGDKCSSRVLTGDGAHVLLWLKAGEEPTEHILNEMIQERERFEDWASRILFFVSSKEAWEHPLFEKILRLFPDIRVFYDDFEEHVPSVGRRLYVDHEKLPLLAVTRGEQNVIYASSGYQVGTADLVLRILEEAS